MWARFFLSRIIIKLGKIERFTESGGQHYAEAQGKAGEIGA